MPSATRAFRPNRYNFTDSCIISFGRLRRRRKTSESISKPLPMPSAIPEKRTNRFFRWSKKRKKHFSLPPSFARCFRCGRTRRHSTTCYVQMKKTPFKPKNDFRPRKR
ncbi:hypothetical protein DQ04_18021010 [Trypanosoma grayi]|uniref:hypothetical protein n=1 Tax=Trypanosoma grayi TaxID=71804 RepID=UPI0004F40F63|nr:hypothetical protein DQ04_18021010 [Trypanosoma grayi]KEG05837.1 hypothetical protein DQ04_18021010 [Trypanosoma grayi]